MIRQLTPLLSLFFIVTLLSGCARNPPQYNYYTLQVSAERVDNPLPLSLGIAPVEIPAWLDQTNLIWSNGDVRLQTAESDRWAEPLSDAMSRILMQNISYHHGGSDLSLGPWNRTERPQRVLTVQVLSLGRTHNKLIMDVKWQLTDQDRKLIFREDQTYEENLDDTSDTTAYVRALGRLLENLAREAASQVR